MTRARTFRFRARLRVARWLWAASLSVDPRER